MAFFKFGSDSKEEIEISSLQYRPLNQRQNIQLMSDESDSDEIQLNDEPRFDKEKFKTNIFEES
jgi:hypothetical protein